MFRVKRREVRSIARLATRCSPALMRTRGAARNRSIIVDSLTHLLFTIQPETGLASLGTRALEDPDGDPEACENEESKDTAHGGLHAVACSNRRGFKDVCRLKSWDTASLSPFLVAVDSSVLHERSESFASVHKLKLTSAR